MPPIPIVMCGKSPSHAAQFSSKMLPGYEVLLHFSTAQEAISLLPKLLPSTPNVHSTSGIGTLNSSTSNSADSPRGIFVGGGFTEEELETMRAECGAAREELVWIAADPNKKDEVAQRGLDAMMDSIVARAKEGFARAGLVEGGTVEKGSGVWRY